MVSLWPGSITEKGGKNLRRRAPMPAADQETVNFVANKEKGPTRRSSTKKRRERLPLKG